MDLLHSSFQDYAFRFVKQLEKATRPNGHFFLSRQKADYIRQQLEVVYDRESRSIIDLQNPQNPREEAVQASILCKKHSAEYRQIVEASTIKEYDGYLPVKVLKHRSMQPLLELFSGLDLSNLHFVIYGERYDRSFYIDDDPKSKRIIAVSPDLYGLPTHIALNVLCEIPYYGYYTTRIGSELIGGCAELIAQEEMSNFEGVAGFIKKLVEPLEYNPRLLAKDFILGNPDPLFSALQEAHPLAPALLTFISDKAGDTPTGIRRLDIMDALDLYKKKS